MTSIPIITFFVVRSDISAPTWLSVGTRSGPAPVLFSGRTLFVLCLVAKYLYSFAIRTNRTIRMTLSFWAADDPATDAFPAIDTSTAECTSSE
jgi:hypothetical protein